MTSIRNDGFTGLSAPWRGLLFQYFTIRTSPFHSLENAWWATDAVLVQLDLLAEEHPNLLFVATSNFPKAVDSAFLSRADLILEVPLPDKAACRQILADCLGGLAKAYPAIGKLTSLPEKPFKSMMSDLDGGLDAIIALAEQCMTSRTATAIRFAELSRQATAVVVSTGDTIDYCFMSDAMKTLPKLSWLRKGTKLPVGTATAAFAARRDDVLAGKVVSDEVDVRDWLGGETRRSVLEESIGLGAYGKVLTVLSSKTIGRDDDEDDGDEMEEERLVESWTPRFR